MNTFFAMLDELFSQENMAQLGVLGSLALAGLVVGIFYSWSLVGVVIFLLIGIVCASKGTGPYQPMKKKITLLVIAIISILVTGVFSFYFIYSAE